MRVENAVEGYTDPGTMAWVTGWGLTDEARNIVPTNLQKAQMPVVSNSVAGIV